MSVWLQKKVFLMDYKKLFARISVILTNPEKAWTEIKTEVEEDDASVQSSFVYPMIALCGTAMFVGMLFGNGVAAINLQLVLTKCCGLFVSLFGGFFLSSYLLAKYGHRFSGTPQSDATKCQQLVGYSMCVIFVLSFFSGLFPSFFILRWILQFYLVYIVWEGTKVLMEVAESHRLSYTIVASAIILIAPVVLSKLFAWMSNLVNG